MLDVDFSDINIEVVENDGKVGTFNIGPLPRGYGHTLANPLRRILLSSLPGGGVTSMKIAGVQHEYSTLKGVKETVVDIMMNVKGIRFKCESDDPQVVRISTKGENEIKAKDLELTESIEVMNPDHVLATITDSSTSLDMEFVVERGVGYRSADTDSRSESGRLPMDADFSPVERVTFNVTSTRKGEKTNLDLIVMQVVTDGSVDPKDALMKATEVSRDVFDSMNVLLQGGEVEPKETEEESEIQDEVKDWRIEDLSISTRAKSSLIDAGIEKLDDLLSKTGDELLEVPGFGEKALEEVREVLDEYGMKLK